jgi:oxygen-independent coproporphyrinogen III oxidase
MIFPKSVDFDVLKRFAMPGPRYTSYPTAPVFTPDFSQEDFRDEIIATNSVDSETPLSLYFHFPFCAKLCYFCGCNMRVTNDRALISKYLDHLEKEIDMIAAMIGPRRAAVQMHWGGGTPTHLSPAEISRIGDHIKDHFQFAPGIEASVEIDPRNLTEEHVQALAGIGFNRTSFGVQDFDPVVQEAVNRVQSEEITRQTFKWVRDAGFESINLDLIYGLPHQTVSSFAITLDKVIDISPDRIAVFNYAHVPWLKKHQGVMPAEAMPSADARLAILEMTIGKLIDAGYEYIGMDHFAKPTDELAVAQRNGSLYRNFQGYSTRAGADVYALGLSSISQFENIYAQNLKDLGSYYDRVNAGELATHVGYRMTGDDHIRRETIMKLMCNLEVDKASIGERFGIDFDEYFRSDIPKLDPFIREGLVEHTEDQIRVTGSGILIIRNIAMCFDAYLEKMMKEKPVFSKTV